MTNQNNEFGKSPVKLSSPTQIWIDDVNQNNELDEPMPCLGYTSAIRINNGVRCCMGCEQPLSKHPVPYRTQAPEPNERKMVTIAVDKNLIPTVWCDPEIADLVTALNLAEIPTIASCSGHGLRNGNIALEDGRELIIAENFEEARRMENATQKAKNIRLTRAEPVESGELRTTAHKIYLCAIGKYSGLPEDNILAELEALLAQEKAKWEQPNITGGTSDGYHTFNELYDYRRVYNAILFNEWARQGIYGTHKSWKHSDGEDCFGGGWFIVMATLLTGQISNHYEAKHWNDFDIPEQPKADEYDGHTPQEALTRLAKLLDKENI